MRHNHLLASPRVIERCRESYFHQGAPVVGTDCLGRTTRALLRRPQLVARLFTRKLRRSPHFNAGLPLAPARRLRIAGIILACLGATAPAAGAAKIDGTPLDISADGSGHMQARFDGSPAGEFEDANADLASAGIIFAAFDPAETSADFHGAGYPDFAPVSAPIVSGSGTSLDPFKLTTVYDVGPGGNSHLRVTQVLEYANGDTGFTARYTTENTAASGADKFRAIEFANLSHAGSSLGEGFSDLGPPASVGGLNFARGSLGALVEQPSSPWSAFQEGSRDEVFAATSNIFPSQAGGGIGLDNSIDPSLVDDAVGAQWDKYRSTGLAAGQTDTFEIRWEFEAFDGLALDPIDSAHPVGGTAAITASSLNHGMPVANKAIRYDVSGANPTSGSASTSPSGTAPISWTGKRVGVDTLHAYVDSNGNGSLDTDETDDFARVRWEGGGSPAPTPTQPAFDTALAIANTRAGRFASLNGSTLRLSIANNYSQHEDGALEISLPATSRQSRSSRRRAVVLARGHFSLAAHAHKTIKLRVTKRGRRALRHRRRIRARLKLSVKGPNGKSASVTRPLTIRVRRAQRRAS
jgi:hypothetical protein